MKNLEEIKKTLNDAKPLIKMKFNVKEIGIFGSFVRGENKRESDIDLLVEFDEPVGFFAFLDLEEYLEGILGLKVDLVSKKALKPRIGKYILEELIQV
jgi:predicted nucleotidyltransferase